MSSITNVDLECERCSFVGILLRCDEGKPILQAKIGVVSMTAPLVHWAFLSEDDNKSQSHQFVLHLCRQVDRIAK